MVLYITKQYGFKLGGKLLVASFGLYLFNQYMYYVESHQTVS